MQKVKAILYSLLKFLAELKVFNSGNSQRLIYSFKNRYPELFSAAVMYFQVKRIKPTILSFGCSHGEEILTIRNYFPDSIIEGVEKNWLIRNVCRWRIKGTRISVSKSLYSERVGKKSYNLIFALAVLQQSDDWGIEKQIFKFSDFELYTKKLDSLLTINGLLVIDNADFDFLDTSVSEKYKVLNFNENAVKPNRILYDVNSRQDMSKDKVFRVFVKEG